MAQNTEEQKQKGIWDVLHAIDRRWLYLILVVLVATQIICPITVPNVPDPKAEGLYKHLSGLQEGDFVMIESDWTNSTRGESLGQFKALMRLLMRKKVRFAITCIADPQIPDILRPIIEELSEEEGNNSYVEGQQWVMCGYFPNAEAHVSNLVSDIRGELRQKQFAGRSIIDTPVFDGINDLSDAKAVVLVTASASINLWYERIRNKTTLGLMCTAVMSAENVPYYVSKQLVGIVIGAKGAFDFETLLAQEWPADQYPQYKSYGAGNQYMSPLFFALMLMVLSVIVGNVAMYMRRREQG